MKEHLLKRKLNPFLLITTVLVLSILAGLSVMYQSELSNLVSTRNTLQNELNQQTEKAKSLQNMNENLNSTIRTLEESISEKNQEINQKDQTISDLQENLEQTETRLERIESQYSAINGTVDELNSTIDTLNYSLGVICSNNTLVDEYGDAEVQCSARGHID